MKKRTYFLISAILTIIIMASSGCKPWTIVKNEEEVDDGSIQIYFENDDFDAESFAEGIWDNELLDYFDERKVQAAVLVDGLKTDEAGTGEQYAIGSNDIGSKWQFIVEGKVKLLEVDTESRAGIMMVDLEPYDDRPDMTIQIGPVIKGSAIRDTLDYIKLDDFGNQVEFASISKAFNKFVVEDVIAGQDFSQHIGEELNILGCFTFEDVEHILLSPISISVLEGE